MVQCPYVMVACNAMQAWTRRYRLRLHISICHAHIYMLGQIEMGAGQCILYFCYFCSQGTRTPYAICMHGPRQLCLGGCGWVWCGPASQHHQAQQTFGGVGSCLSILASYLIYLSCVYGGVCRACRFLNILSPPSFSCHVSVRQMQMHAMQLDDARKKLQCMPQHCWPPPKPLSLSPSAYGLY